MEEEITIFTAASTEPVVTSVALGGFNGDLTVTTTRLDKGDDTGAGLFYVDVSVSALVPSYSTYNILSSSDSNDFISLTDSKGKTWDDETPVGVTATATGYTMILKEIGSYLR